MPHILSIETSADACSVSLLGDGREVSREAEQPRSHARMLVPLIQELLQSESVRPEAICVDAGPGSYTGLRIGVSTAKGMAWSLGIPLYAVPSLALMAAGYLGDRDTRSVARIRPIVPARGEEVYSALYNVGKDGLQVLEEPGVRFLEDVRKQTDETILIAPNQLLGERMGRNVRVVAPHSRHAALLMGNPGDEYRVEDVSSFEPLYLREFEARKPAVSIFDRLPF